MNYKKLTAIFVVLTIVGIGVFDVYVFTQGGTEATVSWTIFTWGHKYPAFTFFMGFVMGHFFWQMKPMIKMGSATKSQ